MLGAGGRCMYMVTPVRERDGEGEGAKSILIFHTEKSIDKDKRKITQEVTPLLYCFKVEVVAKRIS